MASWDKGVREKWKSKDGRLAKETPSYSGASSSAAPWNSQPQQQRDHSSWAAAAVEQWTGSAATAAPSSPSTWWNQKKAPMEATLQTGFDPWTKSDPWQVSSTWASPSPEARALNSDQGQMDTQQSSTSMTQGRQLDTQHSQLPLVPAQRRTQFGVALPPVYNAFGGAAYQKQRPPPAIKQQWIEGPLYRKFGLEPALLRTPRCHRRGHKHPSDLRITMKNFPAKWRADEKAEGSFTAIKCEVDQIAGTGKIQMPTEIRAESRFIFDHWLGGRSMGDMRVIREVTSMHEVLAMTAIIPGFTWSDFDHTPEMPTKTNAEEWDLYLTDFATDTYSPLASYLDMKYSKVDGKVVLPQGLWLRYHGCNMYAMSSILATNMAAASDEEVVASETACGRGVYTSQSWEQAQQYAMPHRLPGSKVFTKTIALFVIPGASGVGGVGVWIKKTEAL